jgi:hypothetical protein
MTAEFVILVPVVMTMVLFVTHVGRVQTASQAVRHVADMAARSGSRAAGDRAVATAHHKATLEMSRSDHDCERFAIGVSVATKGEIQLLTTEVSCRVRTAGLSMLRLPAALVKASSTETIDRYRGSR